MRFVIETDSEQEHRMYLAGPRLLEAVCEFQESLRQHDKYGTEETTTWAAVRELFRETCGGVMDEATDE